MTAINTESLPKAFVWRRLHSLFGLWIVIFLLEHLLTNSQAALLLGESGEGFVRAVNLIKHLPYLPVIEIVLLGVPIAFHGALGIKYALDGKSNALFGGKKAPRLGKYPRNHAYVWQRITSWILLIGIIAHVGFMRFYMYPAKAERKNGASYFVRIGFDSGLYTLADRLGVTLYDQAEVHRAEKKILEQKKRASHIEEMVSLARKRGENRSYDREEAELFAKTQELQLKEKWLQGLTKRPLAEGQVIAEASDFGTATLLIVRDAFKSIVTSIFYTIFVLAAVFHACNGLWTFMISWGIVLRMRSQSRAVNWCVGIMIVIGFLGLSSIWGSYWINLRS